MPTNITPSATWTGVIPTPDDGEVATGAGLDAMAQPLANREEYLKNVVDVVGPRRMRNVADFTALKALTGNADLDVVLVDSKGVYWFDAAASDTEALPMIVEPTAGGGRFFHSAYKVIGASGLASVTAGGRLVQLPPHAPIASAATNLSGAYGTNIFFTTAGAWTDVSGVSTSLTAVQVGDLLYGTLSCRAILGAASAQSIGTSSYPKLALAYEHDGTTTRVAEVELQALAAGEVAPVIAWRYRHVVTVSASSVTPHIFKAQLLSDGTVQARVLYPSLSIAIEQVRP